VTIKTPIGTLLGRTEEYYLCGECHKVFQESEIHACKPFDPNYEGMEGGKMAKLEIPIDEAFAPGNQGFERWRSDYLIETPAGQLSCTVHPEVVHWCNHLRRYITLNCDAERLAEIAEPGLMITVPMSPESDFWVTIRFDDLERGNEMLAIILPEPMPTSSVEHRIGVWNRGDGRMMLRSTISGWFEGKLMRLYETSPRMFSQKFLKEGDLVLQCAARGHSLREETAVQDAITRGYVLRENWTIFWNTFCTSCMLKLADVEASIPKSPAGFPR